MKRSRKREKKKGKTSVAFVFSSFFFSRYKESTAFLFIEYTNAFSFLSSFVAFSNVNSAPPPPLMPLRSRSFPISKFDWSGFRETGQSYGEEKVHVYVWEISIRKMFSVCKLHECYFVAYKENSECESPEFSYLKNKPLAYSLPFNYHFQ